MTDPIIIYPLGGGSKWRNEELRHSLRSVHQFWKGRRDVFILGKGLPDFLEKSRVHFIECPGYADCIEMAIQLARSYSSTDDFLWMNDDIFFLRDCDPSECEAARRYRRPMTPKAPRKTDNGWWKKLDRVRDQCHAMGIDPIYNFSTHTPYLYNADKLEVVIAVFGLLFKTPLETAYFNFWAHEVESRVMDDKLTFFKDRTMPHDIRDKAILNVSDNGLSPRIKGYIRGMFCNPSPYEKAWERDAAKKVSVAEKSV